MNYLYIAWIEVNKADTHTMEIENLNSPFDFYFAYDGAMDFAVVVATFFSVSFSPHRSVLNPTYESNQKICYHIELVIKFFESE